MHILRYLGAAVAVFGAAAPAQGQQAGVTYDCNAPADQFSEHVLPAPGSHFVVSGEVQLGQIPKVGQHVPATRVQISSETAAPGQSAPEVAGFVLEAIPARALNLRTKDDKAVVQYVFWDERSGGTNKDHVPFGPIEYLSSLSFSLTFDGTSVTIVVGGKQQQIALAAAKPVVRMICSTGEFLFTNLRIEPAP